jgi:hypothetical protein
MSRSNLDEAQVRAMALELGASFESGDFFRVVMLSPQLMVQVAQVISNHHEEWIRRKGFLDFSADELTVYALMDRLHRADSDRVQIASAFHSIFENELGTEPNARKNFVNAFSKLESLVSMRNRIAHDYFRAPASKRSLKACAAGGIDLLRRLLKEME